MVHAEVDASVKRQVDKQLKHKKYYYYFVLNITFLRTIEHYAYLDFYCNFIVQRAKHKL